VDDSIWDNERHRILSADVFVGNPQHEIDGLSQ